jgi:YVTN family beta-propeller protein
MNHEPGTVPVSITEFYPSAPKVADQSAYALVKQEADFPVTKFWADPGTLYDVEQTVTLYWDCSQQGQNYSYGLRSDIPDLQLRHCVADGNCYTCSDGAGGVETARLGLLNGITEVNFYLDIVQTDSGGNRTVHATLKTSVRVALPSISNLSGLTQYFAGRVVRMNWLAFNASRCAVELNGEVIDDNAPVDTYELGYVLVLPGTPGTYQLAVTASAQTGTATCSHLFPDVTVGRQPQTINLGATAGSVAITPDGSLALVANINEGSITVIDLPTLTPRPAKIPMSFASPERWYSTQNMAITPDGKLALVAHGFEHLSLIDMETLTVRPETLQFGWILGNIAITPDGKLAFVSYVGASLTVIDLSTLTVRPETIPLPRIAYCVAAAPDSKLILAGIESNVVAIDVATLSTEIIPGPAGMLREIVVTPDNSLALVLCDDTNGVAVIDLPARKFRPERIPVPGELQSIAMTPDGSLAFVVNGDNATVNVIDVATLTVSPYTIPAGATPDSIVVTPDGATALVTNSTAKTRDGDLRRAHTSPAGRTRRRCRMCPARRSAMVSSARISFCYHTLFDNGYESLSRLE